MMSVLANIGARSAFRPHSPAGSAEASHLDVYIVQVTSWPEQKLRPVSRVVAARSVTFEFDRALFRVLKRDFSVSDCGWNIRTTEEVGQASTWRAIALRIAEG
jgi:hypothetical protein